MSRQEVTSRRTATSRTFEDGNQFVTEIALHDIHHKENGLWVPFDCTISGTDDYSPRSHGKTITIPANFASPFRCGDLTFRPLDFTRPPARVVKGSVDVFYEQAWEGVDVRRVVLPEGVAELLTVTSAAGQRIVRYEVTGDIDGLDAFDVPSTFADGVLSLDLTATDIGKTGRW